MKNNSRVMMNVKIMIDIKIEYTYCIRYDLSYIEG